MLPDLKFRAYIVPKIFVIITIQRAVSDMERKSSCRIPLLCLPVSSALEKKRVPYKIVDVNNLAAVPSKYGCRRVQYAWLRRVFGLKSLK